MKQSILFLILISTQVGFVGLQQLKAQAPLKHQFEVNLGSGLFLLDDPGLLVNGHVRILIPKSKNDNEFTLGVIYDKLLYARRGISYSYDLINVTGSY